MEHNLVNVDMEKIEAQVAAYHMKLPIPVTIYLSPGFAFFKGIGKHMYSGMFKYHSGNENMEYIDRIRIFWRYLGAL